MIYWGSIRGVIFYDMRGVVSWKMETTIVPAQVDKNGAE